MKKLLLIAILMLALVFTVVACTGGETTEDTTVGDTTVETPTDAPTEEPTDAPTEEPTDAPTEEPTDAPTEEPTDAPTEEPTEAVTEPTVTLDKTEYQIGESIMVSATGSGKDWAGIVIAGTDYSIRWWYIADVGEGTAIDVLNDSHIHSGTGDANGALPAGEYEVVWVANDSSIVDAPKVYRYKFTVVDPNAPVLMLDAEALNTLAGAAAPNVNQLGSTEIITEGSKTFVRWTAAGGDPYVAILPLGSSATLPQYMAISYRTNSAVEGQFFVGSGAGWTGNGDSFMVTWTEGDWSFVIVDLTQTGVTSITDGLLTYARMDFFAGDSAEGDYFDVQYVGFFNTAEDAQAYDDKVNFKVPAHTDETIALATGHGAPYGAEKKFGQRYNIGENFLKQITVTDMATYADGNTNKWSVKIWAWNTDYATTTSAKPLFVLTGENHKDNTSFVVDVPAEFGIRGDFYYEVEYLEGSAQFTGWTADNVAEGVETYANGNLKDGSYASSIVVGVALPTHYDNYTVPQDQWVMTGHNTQLNDASNGMVAAGGVEYGALLHQGSIALGEIDLSKYSKVIVMWGCDNSDVTVNHYNASANNRIMLLNAVMDGVMSPAEETIIAGGTYELKGWAVTAFEIDLTDVDYNGPVWLAIDALPGTFALFASVEFIGAEIDYTPVEPETPEEPAV